MAKAVSALPPGLPSTAPLESCWSKAAFMASPTGPIPSSSGDVIFRELNGWSMVTRVRLLLNPCRFDVLYLSFTMVVGERLMSVLPDLR